VWELAAAKTAAHRELPVPDREKNEQKHTHKTK